MDYAFGVILESILPYPGSLQFSRLFSCRSLIVLPLAVKCIIQFELIFMYDVWWGFQFYVCVCGYSAVLAPFVEFPGHICQNSIDCEYNSLFGEFQFWSMDLCAYVRTTLLCYSDFIITMELGSVRPPPVIFFFRIVWGPLHYKRKRQWHPTSVFLPGKSHGQRSLVGCSPWGR